VNMLKQIIMAVSMFLCLSGITFTFDMEECKRWEDVIYGPELDIDWELKGEDWGQQFCNIPASRNHRHFFEPNMLGRWSGAAPSFVEWESERVLVIRCVNNRKATYIHVAWVRGGAYMGKALAVWRQDELAY
jgi:hypothetical protein